MKIQIDFILLLLIAAVVFRKPAAATTRIKECFEKTTLATFNLAINPFFEGFSGTLELEERTELLITEVLVHL